MLDAATADTVQAHLATCVQCSTLLADYEQVDHLLVQAPRVAPRPELRDRIFSSPEFREIMESQRQGAVAKTPSVPLKVPPHVIFGSPAARVWLPVVVLIIMLSGTTAIISKILAGHSTDATYATCPSLSNGQRLVYRTGNALYSNDDPLVCETQTQVGLWQTSPDGHWVAYMNDRTHTLRLVHADATQDHQVAISAGAVQTLIWSPDSTHLIFAQTDARSTNTVTFWMVDTVSRQPQKLGELKGFVVDSAPVIASDSQTVAVAMKSVVGNSNHKIFVFSTHVGAPNGINAAVIPAAAPVTALGWVEDGSDPILTWVEGIGSGDATLGSIHRSAVATPNITMHDHLGDITTAAYSAMSDKWAVVTINGTIIGIDVRMGTHTPLAQVGTATTLAPSPDGTQWLVTSGHTLWLLTDSGLTKLTDLLGMPTPTWSTNAIGGNAIAFVANGKVQIATVLAGKVSSQIADTSGVGTIAGLSWSPNGGALAIWGSAGIAIDSSAGQQLSLLTRVASGPPQWTA